MTLKREFRRERNVNLIKLNSLFCKFELFTFEPLITKQINMTSNIKAILIILGFVLTMQSFAQNFSGKIIDDEKQAIIGSTILIKELSQGIVCDEDGKFQVTLPVGIYHVEYRCIGYESIVEKITIKRGDKLTRDVILKEKPVALQEIVVSKGQEDPAYAIMRQAIKKAPYYQNVVKKYEAESYIKGNMELIKVSKLVDRLSKTEGIKMSDFKDNNFVQESHSVISFTAPDAYEQRVKAFSSSIPDNLDPHDAMRLSTSSLYLPRFSGLISPLHPKAFTYYNYRYEGYAEEGKSVVNKIKIIPKVKDPELMDGYLYIAENSWDIRHADLISHFMGVEQHFVINYDEMKVGIYLPTTFSNKIAVNMMGVEGSFNYYASTKYLNIIVDDSILDNKQEKKKEKKNLEVKWNDKYEVKTDSLATKQDSAYWQEVRSIPLSKSEQQSYVVKDSIQQYVDSVRKEHINASFHFTDLLTGGQLGGDSTKFTFKYGGVLGALRDYNFVDGFGLGQKLELSTKVHQNNKLTLGAEAYYTTAREAMVWSADLQLDYAPLQLGQLSLSAGDTSSDFNQFGVSKLDNAINSLVYGRNRAMLYRNKFAEVSNTISIINGLELGTKLKMAERSPLKNNTRYSFFGARRKSRENVFSPHYGDLLSYDISLKYNPEIYYRIRNGKKQYLHSKYPTFMLHYSEGFSSIKSDNAHFRMLEGGVRQIVKTDLFSTLDYQVSGGGFLGSNTKMNFADFKHFSTADDLWLTSKSPFSSFMLLDAYRASTNEYWFSTQVNYDSKYILLKRLPFLQGKMFNESLHLKYLYTPNLKNYTEVSYSINLFRSLSVGVNTAFLKFKYDAVGFKLSYNLDLMK